MIALMSPLSPLSPVYGAHGVMGAVHGTHSMRSLVTTGDWCQAVAGPADAPRSFRPETTTSRRHSAVRGKAGAIAQLRATSRDAGDGLTGSVLSGSPCVTAVALQVTLDERFSSAFSHCELGLIPGSGDQDFVGCLGTPDEEATRDWFPRAPRTRAERATAGIPSLPLPLAEAHLEAT